MTRDPQRNPLKRWSPSRQCCPVDVCACQCEPVPTTWNNPVTGNNIWPAGAPHLLLPVKPIYVYIEADPPPSTPTISGCFECCTFPPGNNPELENAYWANALGWKTLRPLYKLPDNVAPATNPNFSPYSWEPWDDPMSQYNVLCGGWTGTWIHGEWFFDEFGAFPGGPSWKTRGLPFGSCSNSYPPPPNVFDHVRLETYYAVSCDQGGGVTFQYQWHCEIGPWTVPSLMIQRTCGGGRTLLYAQCMRDCGYHEEDANGEPIRWLSGDIKFTHTHLQRDCRKHPICRCAIATEPTNSFQCFDSGANPDGLCTTFMKVSMRPSSDPCANGLPVPDLGTAP